MPTSSQPQMSTATSIASMAQQLSRGFGISIVAVLLHLSLAWRGSGSLDHADFVVAFAGAAVMSMSALLFCWNLPHDTGAEVSGHRPKLTA